jgi:outer membrane protein OmpA-like peptidoglycan-associated protein
MKLHFLFLTTILTLPIFGQNLPKMKEDADALFEQSKYSDAVSLYSKYLELKPNTIDVLRNIGVAYYNLNNLGQARAALTPLAENVKAEDPVAYLYLAKTAHAELKWKDAVKYYKMFLKSAKPDNPNRKAVIKDIARCAVGKKIQYQTELALVENLGEKVNSSADEFGPVLSPNVEGKIYFSANKTTTEGGMRNDEGISDDKRGHYSPDIYVTEIESGDWAEATPLNNLLVNTSRYETILGFDSKGTTLTFFRGLNANSGEILADTYKPSEETRALPQKANLPIDGEIGDNSLFFFRDTILIFASRRAGGFGGLDLYSTTFNNGKWTDPQNLGAKINSGYDETTPFLARDGRTLYFSSNSTKSMGGLDIFKSTYNDELMSWSEPTNLGTPINTAGDDAYFRLANDGMKAYYSSNRKDINFGGKDLYSVIFKSYQKEQGTTSMPLVFSDVPAYKQYQAEHPVAGYNTQPEKKKEIVFTNFEVEPLYYEDDQDLQKANTLKQLKTVLMLLKQYPQLKLTLVGNSSEGERPVFDLYFTIKRVELVTKYLLANGVNTNQIISKSVGSNYPIARAEMEGKPNIAGIKINKRIDLLMSGIGDLPIKINYNSPAVSEFIVDKTGDKFKKHLKGLSYKVQIVSTKRMFEGEAVTKTEDPMIESTPELEGVYQYTVGLFQDYKSAEKLKLELIKEGLNTSYVVPYLDGLRLTNEEAKKSSTKFSDLLNYLAAKNKN